MTTSTQPAATQLCSSSIPATITVLCETCEQRHPAEFSHRSQHGGHAVYAATCPADYLTDYYTEAAAL